jgi:hypothetical protein
MTSPTDSPFMNGRKQAWETIFWNRCFPLRLYAGIHPKQFGYHRLLSKRFPYAVFYDQEGKSARVWAVLDCRSDPNAIRERLASLRKK